MPSRDRRLRRHRLHRAPHRRAARRAGRAARARRAARSRGCAELAERLGGLEHRGRRRRPPGLRRARSSRPGDVLLSTVGPFKRWGEPAVRGRDRRRRGLHRLDGRAGVHPPRVRRRTTRPRGAPGATLLPAMGYDFVPGALAGALALEEAGADAVRVDVGYYALGGGPARAEPRHPRVARRRLARPGVRVPRRAASPACAPPSGSARSRSAGKDRPAISVGGAEHFTLPAAYPRLREVNVYLGWFGGLARVAQAGSRAGALVTRLPGARGACSRAAGEKLAGDGRRAGARARRRARTSYIAARGLRRRRRAARRGPPVAAPTPTTSPPAASPGRRGAPPTRASVATGAAGPLEAFGLDALEQGCAEAGSPGPERRRAGAGRPSVGLDAVRRYRSDHALRARRGGLPRSAIRTASSSRTVRLPRWRRGRACA